MWIFSQFFFTLENSDIFIAIKTGNRIPRLCDKCIIRICSTSIYRTSIHSHFQHFVFIKRNVEITGPCKFACQIFSIQRELHTPVLNLTYILHLGRIACYSRDWNIQQQIKRLAIIKVAFQTDPIIEQTQFKTQIILAGTFPSQIIICHRTGIDSILDSISCRIKARR